MKKIIYRNPNFLESLIRILEILFIEIMALGILIFIVNIILYEIKNKFNIAILFEFIIAILLLILSYYQVKAIKNAIIYFFPVEEYNIINHKLHYEKKIRLLKKFIVLKKFDIALVDIEKILALAPKKFFYMSSRGFDPIGSIHYFKPCERICIKLKNKNEYNTCNYAKKPNSFSIFADNKESEKEFEIIFNDIKSFIENAKIESEFQEKLEHSNLSYRLNLNKRYNCILNKILDEEKLFLLKKDNNYVVNGDSEAIENLEIFKNMEFEEINFYVFYVNYLSKKEYENQKILVGYNGIDGKEVTMLKLKEDINEIRDSKNSFK